MLCYKPILVKKFWLCFESIQHFHLCGNMNRSNSALGEDWDISLRKRQSRGFRNIWQFPGVGIILIYRRAFSGLLPKMPAFFVWIRVKESAKNCRKKDFDSFGGAFLFTTLYNKSNYYYHRKQLWRSLSP